MTIVIEIASRTGTRACKEYNAPSFNAAVEVAKRELRAYPSFPVMDIRTKDHELVSEQSEEEW